jgi:predicted lipoprotein with Yx(FWY)xxD motif
MRRIVVGMLVVGMLVLGVLGLAVPAGAATAPTVGTARVGKLGVVLVDAKGFVLYRFKPDSANRSTCTGGCARAWPPALKGAGAPTKAKGLTGTLGTLVRADKKVQLTYNGLPLYRYAADTKKGTANGQGVGGVWFVVKPGQRAAAPTAAKPAATTSTTAPRTSTGNTTATTSAPSGAPTATTTPASGGTGGGDDGYYY